MAAGEKESYVKVGREVDKVGFAAIMLEFAQDLEIVGFGCVLFGLP